jgi:hypothetical protein
MFEVDKIFLHVILSRYLIPLECNQHLYEFEVKYFDFALVFVWLLLDDKSKEFLSSLA